DAPIKGRSINEGEAAAERISNDSKEITRVLNSMDAATVLAGGIDVPTGSGFIPTAGPPATVISTGSEVGPTASLIVTRRKGKEVMVESDTPKKKKLQEQIDAQVARELEEQQEKEDVRMNEQIARDAEEAPDIETSIEEFTEEKMKEMMLLVPVEDVYVQALQVKHPIIDWKVHTEEFYACTSRVEVIQSKWSASCDCQRQRDLYASRKRLSTQKGFSTCDDQLQALDNHFILENLNAEGASSLGEDC
nr:hypothetical protein [Tanacetum cinerariifolium]